METNKNIFDHLKTNEIETPDAGYFDQLAKEVIASQKTKVIPLYKKPLAWIVSAAAVFAAVFLLNLGDAEEQDVLLALNEISTEEVYLYIEDHIEDFDTDLISEMIDEENIDPIVFIDQELNPEVETFDETLSFEDIETEDILEYLQNEAVDLDDDDELYI
ncbi:MAG: hypothetical protein QNK23_06915 [Crocinitomicaceae bacterium]|nr:hypothetical protein [Crocinitomicaceae bacterium]